MSYSIEFAPEAIASLQLLEPWLQELALDAVDGAANEGARLRLRRLTNEVIVDFMHEREGIRWYVFIILAVNHKAEHLQVLRFVTHARPADLGQDPPLPSSN